MHDPAPKVPTPLKLGIRAIYVKDSKLHLADNFDPTAGGQELVAEFRVGHVQPTVRVTEANKLFPARTIDICHSFEFRYMLEKASPARGGPIEAAAITAVVVVNYQHDEPEAPSETQLGDWAITNAVQHLWPYWREFCHSSLVRMHLPVVMVPILNIVQVPRLKEPEVVSGEIKGKPSRRRVTIRK